MEPSFFLVNAISKNEANVCENEHIEGNIPFYCRLFRSKIGFNKKNGVLFEDLLNAWNCFIDLLLDGGNSCEFDEIEIEIKLKGTLDTNLTDP